MGPVLGAFECETLQKVSGTCMKYAVFKLSGALSHASLVGPPCETVLSNEPFPFSQASAFCLALV
jgi:hypothetical protein